MRQFRYQVMTLRSRVGSEVHIAFTIDSPGNTSHHRIVRGMGYGCDEKALRAVQLLHTEWIPASANGQPVASECGMPVVFAVRQGVGLRGYQPLLTIASEEAAARKS